MEPETGRTDFFYEFYFRMTSYQSYQSTRTSLLIGALEHQKLNGDFEVLED
ncbi:hypothetical protein L484_023289 [Morus notabilis]|uniref:Uncharacterized protein n=1 Tax=Morus notabilis TaxID=981085 RepID=W9RYZ8_9ROSA|nr:hypothetical protein L484_023289 [Morus notabilis]